MIRFVSTLAFALAFVLGAARAEAQVNANTLAPTFGWAAASGSPAGYEVWVKRSPATTFTREQDVTGTQALLAAGTAGQKVVVYVRGYATGKAYFGPPSDESLEVTLNPSIGKPGRPSWLEILSRLIRRWLDAARPGVVG